MNSANQHEKVAVGMVPEQAEEWIPDLASDDLRRVLEKAFDYRGDVTITLKDGKKIEGYVFDRRTSDRLETSFVRVLPKSSSGKISIAYADIKALTFTGRDTAAGKSWEAWLRKYWEKKAAGEQGIVREPEALD